MKYLKLAALATLLALMSGTALAQETSKGLELAKLSFEAVDRSAKGYVHMGDMEVFRDLVFVSMDTDDSARLSLSEFLTWDYGFAPLAEETDRLLAYRTALKVVFSFWDRNGDGEVSVSEHRHAIIADFKRADLDDDAMVSEKEFLNGFSILVALRSALKPE